jgi:hypothetical protein
MDEDSKQKNASQLIAEANKTLAKLQRERIRTLSDGCLKAYDNIRLRHVTTHKESFTIDPSIVGFLSGSFDEEDFVDSIKSEELDIAAESFAQQLRLYRKRLQNEFDVFLCYNTENKREVKSIYQQLKRRGILPWLDDEELRPGTAWQTKIQQDIESIRSCAVIVGPPGIGPWQQREVEAALQLFVKRNLPVIPVILPSCTSVPELPLFLRSFECVDYRSLDPDPLEQLVWGISGQRPII